MDVTVAVDCMGGDHGAHVTVPAVLDYLARDPGHRHGSFAWCFLAHRAHRGDCLKCISARARHTPGIQRMHRTLVAREPIDIHRVASSMASRVTRASVSSESSAMQYGGIQ